MRILVLGQQSTVHKTVNRSPTIILFGYVQLSGYTYYLLSISIKVNSLVNIKNINLFALINKNKLF